MKDFDWTTFTKRISVKAPMAEIYNAWTRSSEIERWFLSKANYFDKMGQPIDQDSSIIPGGTYEWSWYLYDILEKGSTTHANGRDHIAFTFAGNCPVDITLQQEGEYVTVELVQSNIPTTDEAKRGIRLGCDSGWAFFLVNLKSVYEGGIDLRNKNENLKGMLNN